MTAKESINSEIAMAYKNIAEAERGLKNELTKRVGDYVSMTYVNEKVNYIADKYRLIAKLKIDLAKV
jgi:hypothetical protein